jgi:CRP/FNR family transcriptional regulator, anaerobic regulatory protein
MEKTKAIKRLTAFGALQPEELLFLRSIAGEKKQVPRGTMLRHQEESGQPLYLLLEGWTASVVMFPGGEQQMIKVHIPGDMLGLPSLAVTGSPDGIIALTNVTVRAVDPSGLRSMFEDHPRVAALLFLISQEERVEAMNRMALLGRGSAAARFAGFILHLHRRLRRADETVGMKFEIPLTQHHFGDLIGVTTVHVNRTVQEFRAQGYIRLSRKLIEILNYEALVELAGLPELAIEQNAGWLPRPSRGS